MKAFIFRIKLKEMEVSVKVKNWNSELIPSVGDYVDLIGFLEMDNKNASVRKIGISGWPNDCRYNQENINEFLLNHEFRIVRRVFTSHTESDLFIDYIVTTELIEK